MAKISVSTGLPESHAARIKVLAEKDFSSPANILRKAIIRGLPLVEAEILGPGLAGTPAPRRTRKAA